VAGPVGLALGHPGLEIEHGATAKQEMAARGGDLSTLIRRDKEEKSSVSRVKGIGGCWPTFEE
jgi:hypothetical protein